MESSRRPPSIYQRLPSGFIRLLKIDRSSSWTLLVVPLEDKPRYSALSYVWGDAAASKTIKLERRYIAVTENLYDALRSVQRSWMTILPARDVQDVSIWVDALCVNQKDHGEREQQVLLMGRIYSSAERVISWLGKEDTQLHLAMNTLDLLEDATDIESLHLAHAGDKNRSWASLRALIGLEYWRRVWIVQEVVLAKELLVVCGCRCLKWDTIATVCSNISHLRADVKRYILQHPRNIHLPAWVTLSSAGWTMIDRLVSYRRSRGELPRLRWELCEYNLRYMQATNDKDYVYSILGIADSGITPDYSEQKSVGQVYCELVGAWLKDWQSGSFKSLPELFFLAFSGLSLGSSMPSWAPARHRHVENPGPLSEFEGSENPAQLAVFRHGAPSCEISGQTLHLSMVRVASVIGLRELNDPLRDITRFVLHNTKEGLGSKPLRVMFELLCHRLTGTGPLDAAGLGLALSFFTVLLAAMRKHDEAKQYLLRRTGIRINTVKDFTETFREAIGPINPTMEEEQISQLSAVYFDKISNTTIAEEDEIITAQLKRSRAMSSFCTDSGPFGVAVTGFVLGDEVCFVKGNPDPSLLRSYNGENVYSYISTCHLVGRVVALSQSVVTIKLK